MLSSPLALHRGALASVGIVLAQVVDLLSGIAAETARRRYFPAPHPARATVPVARPPAHARVEIEAIAVRLR